LRLLSAFVRAGIIFRGAPVEIRLFPASRLFANSQLHLTTKSTVVGYYNVSPQMDNYQAPKGVAKALLSRTLGLKMILKLDFTALLKHHNCLLGHRTFYYLICQLLHSCKHRMIIWSTYVFGTFLVCYLGTQAGSGTRSLCSPHTANTNTKRGVHKLPFFRTVFDIPGSVGHLALMLMGV
jgi:hypothetical protein